MPQTNRNGHRYVYSNQLSDGQTVYFFRRHQGSKRHPLPDLKHRDFHKAYHAAYSLAETEIRTGPTKKVDTKKLSWLIGQYLQSSLFKGFSANTQKNYTAQLHTLDAALGKFDYLSINTADIHTLKESLSQTPATSEMLMNAFRSLYKWGKAAGLVSTDPSLGLLPARYKKTPYRAWTDDTVKRYKKAYSIGTRERLAYELLRETGARSSDVICLSPSNLTEVEGRTILSYTSVKTGIVATMPLSAELCRLLSFHRGKGPFLKTRKGKAFNNPNSFSVWFSRTCRCAGIKGYSAHGLRKTAAIDRILAGMHPFRIMAQLGW